MTKSAATFILLGFLGFLGFSFAQEPPKVIRYQANAEWKAVDLSDVQIIAGSALDLTGLFDAGPAGNQGRLIVSKSGHLAFEKSPDVPKRFIGYNGLWITEKLLHKNNPDRETVTQNIVRFAELCKRQGYDMVRPLASDGYLMYKAPADGEFNPERLDHLDRLIAEFKKNGIYTYLTIAGYGMGRADRMKGFVERNDDKLKIYLGDPETRARWKSLAEKQLNHVNPYTGIAWKDDPAIALLEYYNEQETAKVPGRIERLQPATRELFFKKWRDWLIKKYGTVEALSAAWEDESLGSDAGFEKNSIPKTESGTKAHDYALFFLDLSREEMAWFESVVRAAGYKGLTSQFNWSRQLFDSAVRWETSEFVNTHAYTGGATDGIRPGSKIWQGSSVGLGANYWRDLNATRHAGRPFLTTEYHHYFPNNFQYEGGLLFAAYSALQGHDAIMVHEDPVAWEITDPGQPYDDWIARNPVARANEFVAAHLFKRGDVKNAERHVSVNIPSAALHKKNEGHKAFSTEQAKIGLITGFSTAFPDLKKPAVLGGQRFKSDVDLLTDSGAELNDAGEWLSGSAESKNSTFSLKNFVANLKEKNLLPRTNLSDPEKEIFQSDTGEITLKVREKILKVVTPKTEGIALLPGRSETLAALRIENTSIPASIAVISRDNLPVAESGRLVLVYNTEMAFTGMEMSELNPKTLWQTLHKAGDLPVLLRTGTLKASLKCQDPGRMKLYSLGINGARLEKLPLAAGAGSLEILLDTSSLKGSATPFFELTSE